MHVHVSYVERFYNFEKEKYISIVRYYQNFGYACLKEGKQIYFMPLN